MPAEGWNKSKALERAAEVLSLLGDRPDQVLVTQLSKRWNVSPNQVWKYVRMAYRILSVRAIEDRAKELVRSVSRYKKVYERAMSDGDYRAALDAQDRVVKLLRLDELPLPGEEDQAKTKPQDPLTAHTRARLRHALSQLGNLSMNQSLIPFKDTVDEVPVIVARPDRAVLEPEDLASTQAQDPGQSLRSLFAPVEPLHESVH